MPELFTDIDKRRVRIKGVSQDLKVGKTTIRIFVDGCIYCGAEYAPAWFPAQIIFIGIKGTTKEMLLQCCADCYTPELQENLF